MRKLPLPAKRKRINFIKNRLHPLLQAQPFLFFENQDRLVRRSAPVGAQVNTRTAYFIDSS